MTRRGKQKSPPLPTPSTTVAVEDDALGLGPTSESVSKKRKGRGKVVALKIHKSEREKLKREHINDLFLLLATTLELSPPNNGKAAVVGEANRVLREVLVQVERLKIENSNLLAESDYVSVETAELRGETLALEEAVEILRKDIKCRPPFPDPKFGVPSFDELGSGGEHGQPTPDVGPTQQPHVIPVVGPIYVIPVAPSYLDPATASNPTPILSKPHPRYPSELDSWPSDVLRGQS